jgi:trans-2-enoyl-CoA reductase
MLHDFVSLEPGEWVVQNGANSAIGRWVIALCRELGLRSINVVRREELVDELTALGADLVVLDGKEYPKEVASLTANRPPRLGLNAVGGESGRYLARTLAPGGTLVTYGAMSHKPLMVDSGLLIFKDLILRGFWRKSWTATASREEIEAMYAALFPVAAKVQTPIAARYPLREASAAMAHALREKRDGKVLFVNDQ